MISVNRITEVDLFETFFLPSKKLRKGLLYGKRSFGRQNFCIIPLPIPEGDFLTYRSAEFFTVFLFKER